MRNKLMLAVNSVIIAAIFVSGFGAGRITPAWEPIRDVITTILFDLDGTLLPMDQDIFVQTYMKGLAATAAPLGYEPQSFLRA